MKKHSPPPLQNRRRYPRIEYSLDVDCGPTSACEHQGQVTTLGVGGCFIKTPLVVAKDKLIFIRLLLAPESERVMEGVVRGRVAYQTPGVGLGVEFKKLPPGYAEHIEDIVEFHLGGGGDT